MTLIVQAINEQGAASEEVSASIEAVAQLSEKYRTELDSTWRHSTTRPVWPKP